MKTTFRKNLFIGIMLALFAGLASATVAPVVDSQGSKITTGTDGVGLSTDN